MVFLKLSISKLLSKCSLSVFSFTHLTGKCFIVYVIKVLKSNAPIMQNTHWQYFCGIT